MVRPTSIDARFRSLEKSLRELERIDSKSMNEDTSVLVGNILNELSNTLDMTMNQIWKRFCTSRQGKQKPKIYFPCSQTREGLAKTFQQYWMPNAEVELPEIFALVESVQEYKGSTWLRDLKQISRKRHETLPEINKKESNRTLIGKDQDVVINELSVDAQGRVKFVGHGLNRQTGKPEPAYIEYQEEMIALLESTGKEPFEFCQEIVEKSKRLITEIFRHIR